MGGNTSESINVPDTNTSSRFDPVSETFARGPDLAFSAAIDTGFTTVLPLRTGFLLAGGGPNAGVGLPTPGPLLSQTFDPAAQRFTRAGDLKVRHQGTGSGALLADGRVLLTGGGFFGGGPGTEIYDPESRVWKEGSPMGTARRLHTATLLHDGRVLIAGGFVCCVVDGNTVSETPTAALPSCSIRRPAPSPPRARWRFRGRSTGPPCSPTAGCSSPVASGCRLSTDTPGPEHAEVYDPATGTFGPGRRPPCRPLSPRRRRSDGRPGARGRGSGQPGRPWRGRADRDLRFPEQLLGSGPDAPAGVAQPDRHPARERQGPRPRRREHRGFPEPTTFLFE